MRLWTRFSEARQPREPIDWLVGICKRSLVCQNPNNSPSRYMERYFAVTG